jgi:UDP-N-acetylmuramoyl-L-alanyl-D-glutamate--2,6-diaminopimelate ligase
MGAIAEHLADHVIVTADNSRTEPLQRILNDIRSGMKRPGEAYWIEDRRAAIQAAAVHARPGDVVLVAGKGHEDYQIIGEQRFPFDDREEVRKHFKVRGFEESKRL